MRLDEVFAVNEHCRLLLILHELFPVATSPMESYGLVLPWLPDLMLHQLDEARWVWTND